MGIWHYCEPVSDADGAQDDPHAAVASGSAQPLAQRSSARGACQQSRVWPSSDITYISARSKYDINEIPTPEFKRRGEDCDGYAPVPSFWECALARIQEERR